MNLSLYKFCPNWHWKLELKHLECFASLVQFTSVGKFQAKAQSRPGYKLIFLHVRLVTHTHFQVSMYRSKLCRRLDRQLVQCYGFYPLFVAMISLVIICICTFPYLKSLKRSLQMLWVYHKLWYHISYNNPFQCFSYKNYKDFVICSWGYYFVNFFWNNIILLWLI